MAHMNCRASANPPSRPRMSFGFREQSDELGNTITPETTSIPSTILPSETGFRAPRLRWSACPRSSGPPAIGYGLPCVKCKTYYAADLSMCPVCKSEERVSPVVDAASVSMPIVPETALPAPDDAALEEERERFLREFKSQSYASQYKLIRRRLSPRKVWVAA